MEEYRQWALDGRKRDAKYMMVRFNPLERIYRPVYVFPEQTLAEEVEKFGVIIDVVVLAEDLNLQIQQLEQKINWAKFSKKVNLVSKVVS